MNTLQKNITLLAVFGVLGLSLMALRAVTVGKSFNLTNKIGTSVYAGKDFSLYSEEEHDSSRFGGPAYPVWSVVQTSDNIELLNTEYKQELGNTNKSKIYFNFKALSAGQAYVDFVQKRVTTGKVLQTKRVSFDVV